MGVCMSGLFAAGTWLEWLAQPASWSVILQVAGGLGFVIFVHELGHFLVAKACGVKCEKFFLGFDVGGLKLLSFRWGETEYGIGALPLGGYVKMLGQDDNPAAAAAEAERARSSLASGDLPAEPVSGPHPAWDPRSYPAQSVPKRMAIISAGVIMNVIFAVIMASWAFGLGVRELTCTVSSVRSGGAAWRAGLRTGDEIVSINGRRNPVFNDLKHGLTVGSVARGTEFTVRRPGEDSTRTVVLKPDTDLGAPTIGVTSPVSLTVPAAVADKLPGAASRAQPPLQGGDTITAVDGATVATYAELIAALSPARDKTLTLTVERKPVAPAAAAPVTVEIRLPPQCRLTTGLAMTARDVKAVQEGSPAAAAGVRAGDRLLAIDGDPPGDPLTIDDRLRSRTGRTVALTLGRDDAEDRVVELTPREVTWQDDDAAGAGSPAAVSSLGLALTVDSIVAAADGPAAAAGIVAGERIVHAWFVEDGQPVGTGLHLTDQEPNWPVVMDLLQQSDPGTGLRFTVRADGGEERTVDMVPAESQDLFVVDRGLIFEPLTTLVRAGSIGDALGRGTRKTVEDLSLVYGFLGKLWTNDIDPRLVGGPIEIAKQAGRHAQEGFSRLLLFLTMLSANLAVVNFLPIPVLDGGHMVFLAYELVRGKPPSEGVVAVLSYLGLALILTLMLFVFGLDLGLIPRR